MKLIPLSDFVLEQRMTSEEVAKASFQQIQDHICTYYDKVFAYTNFLKQPLTLGMFVPVDENGNVLNEEPEYCFASEGSEHYQRHKKYWKSKEKVLFEGFSSTYNGFSIVSIDRIDVEDNYRLSFNKEGGCRQYYNIEELVMSDENFEIELTPSALEAIGIKE